MTSNVRFDAASVMTNYITEQTMKNNNYTASESETEDEEVRMNCVGGFRGIEDSDMNTTENSDDEDEDALTDDESSRDGFRITHFVANPYKSEVPLICPKPKTPALRRLSPLEEAEDEPESIDDPANVELRSDSNDSMDSKSDIIEVESCDMGMQNDLADKAILDPYPQGFESELTEIMVSIGDALELVLDESESSSRLCYIGVMKDMESSAAVMRGPKRGLCPSDDWNDNMSDVYKKARSVTIDLPTVIRPITLLPTNLMDQAACSCSLSSLFAMKIREESPALMSTDDDDDLDRQLGEELDDQYRGDGQETPVPLLTPPGSPLTVEWEGAATTLCEWPSNLIVDSALQAVNELRPMSPTSLENLERDEYDRIVAFSGGTSTATTGSMIGNEFVMKITPTTPMLKSVFV